MRIECDVAIIGGGPAGSTAGCLLKKYAPSLDVHIFERERFPREHVGESQLPPISKILYEMGCWDKVEAANFPIKIGATYKWGRRPELWDFEFIQSEAFIAEARPAQYTGQRTLTAFQVDRSIYDKILLDHAEEFGCNVSQETKVVRVHHDGDRVEGLELESGDTVSARHYVDATGHSGLIRRAMEVASNYPTTLQNIAMWDYWQNADWAVEIGVGGTRVQVISVGYGWIWFIPLGPTRTSVGLVMPAEHFKKAGRKLDELYREALQADPHIVDLMKNAASENLFQTTKDWSFLAERQVGENWFLAGESGGFADPILAAGMTMAHMAGKEVACTIIEMDRGIHSSGWLKEQYQLRQAHRINDHIRFADYWYTANSQFKELQTFTAQIAKDAGLDLTPEKAWAWLAQGGFIDEDLAFGTGGFTLQFLKSSGEFLTEIKAESPLERCNVFKLDLEGADKKDRAKYAKGGVGKSECYLRSGKVLPVGDAVSLVLQVLKVETRLPQIVEICTQEANRNRVNRPFLDILSRFPRALEAMVYDGWVKATHDPSMPLVQFRDSPSTLRWNQSSH
jgi:flavin-dependent dehydrogenase